MTRLISNREETSTPTRAETSCTVARGSMGNKRVHTIGKEHN